MRHRLASFLLEALAGEALHPINLERGRQANGAEISSRVSEPVVPGEQSVARLAAVRAKGNVALYVQAFSHGEAAAQVIGQGLDCNTACHRRSLKRTINLALARNKRHFTVPIGMPSAAAISWYSRSST